VGADASSFEVHGCGAATALGGAFLPALHWMGEGDTGRVSSVEPALIGSRASLPGSSEGNRVWQVLPAESFNYCRVHRLL